MGEHLSFEEKSRAFDEYCENSQRIKKLKKKIFWLKHKEENKNEVQNLKDEIHLIVLRQKRLSNFLSNRKNSKYGGMFGKSGLCYKMFGKKAKDLTKEERRLYNKIKQQQHRSKIKKDKETKENAFVGIKEKYIRGQKDFTQEIWQKIDEFYRKEINNGKSNM